VQAAFSIERIVTRFARAIVVVLDSLGVGELPDAAAYGDVGSNTLGNIAQQVPLLLPTLRALGFSLLVDLPGGLPPAKVEAAYGKMAERAPGKDSVTGHWELMGLVLDRPFPVFADGFPSDVISEFERRIGRKTLGNYAASGTVIIEDLGAEHIRTGAPIVYTSADSVFQIAAHEDVIPVDELYNQCRVAYGLVVDGLGVGRVIARPFVGTPGRFQRTANRRDFALPPVGQTVLDRAKAAGLPVIGIGKIEDLFTGRGITRAVHAKSDDEVMDAVERAMAEVDRGIIVANLVDFDSKYGHRNDVQGYAANLERVDARVSEVLARLGDPDLLMLTADHGNDPTTPSTDHSREYVPLIVAGPRVRAGSDLGVRSTFADLGQTLADVFSLAPMPDGTSFLGEI
jgi:phosphopentomutase